MFSKTKGSNYVEVKSNIVDELNKLSQNEQSMMLQSLQEEFQPQSYLTSTELLHFFSHEVKNDIQVIDGFLSLLSLEKENSSKKDAYLNVLTHQSKELKALVMDSINWSNCEITEEEIPINQLLLELDCCFTKLYPHIQLRFKYDNFSFIGDKFKLKKILFNLIKNSCEAVDVFDNMIQISVEIVDDALQFQVKDNGMGMPKEVFENIFIERHSTKKEGFGIGLKLCKLFANHHNGDLKCNYSNQEQGTLFTLNIPYKPI